MGILTERKTWRRNPEPEPTRLGNRLNHTERDNLRRAVEYIVGRHASIASVCDALGMTRDMLLKARSRYRAQTYRLACTVARAAGVPVEKILTGLWPGDRCPHCGGTGKASQIVEMPGSPKKRVTRPL